MVEVELLPVDGILITCEALKDVPLVLAETSKLAPEATLIVAELAIAPAELSANEPVEIVVLPLKVLFPVKINDPEPVLVIP